MVQNIQIIDNSQRLFDLNIELFKSKYPEIYSNFNSEEEDAYYDFQESLNEDDDIFNYSNKKNIVSIELSHSERVFITNVDIHKWYQSNFMDAINIWSDELYVYFSIDSSMSQSGSIGIWSIINRDWIFSHRDEGFCTEAVVHEKESDIFIGFYYWHIPMVNNSGEGFYLIDKKRKYHELKTETFYSKDKETDNSLKTLDSYLSEINTSLAKKISRNNYFVVDIKQRIILFINNDNEITNAQSFVLPK